MSRSAEPGAVSAIPNPIGPEDSQNSPQPNSDINRDPGKLRDRPSQPWQYPAKKLPLSRFSYAGVVEQLQTFDYNSVVDQDSFERLYSIVGHMLPSLLEYPSEALFRTCVFKLVSHAI